MLQGGASFHRAWPKFDSALEQRPSLGRPPPLGEDGRKLEIGVEVVWIQRQLFVESLDSAIGVAGKEERPAIIGLKRRHLGVQGRGLGELLDGPRVIPVHEQGRPQQEVPLGRISPAQDSVHVDLPFSRAPAANQSQSQDIIQGILLVGRRSHRRQQADGLRKLSGLQVTIAQQQGDPHIIRTGGMQGLKLMNGLRELRRLIVGEREIETKPFRDLRRGQFHGSAVLLDGLLIASEARQHHSEVGTEFYTAGIGRYTGPVLARGTLQIASLM